MITRQPTFDRDEIYFEVEATQEDGGSRMGFPHTSAGAAIMWAWARLIGVSRGTLIVTEVHRQRGSGSTEHRPAFEINKIDGGEKIQITDLTRNWKEET